MKRASRKHTPEAWAALTPEIQAHLIILSEREVQNASDIQEGLLATLNEYRGLSSVKKRFAEAITKTGNCVRAGEESECTPDSS